jgi:hypothetical protein
MTEKSESKESPLVNLAFNIVVPAVVLSKLCGEDKLGPLYGLIVALMFPVGYGLFELLIKKRKNFISLLGFVSTLLTGVIGLMKFPPEWVAIKEAFIPFLIGMTVLISIWTPFPLVRKLLYIKEIFQIDRIDEMLDNEEKKIQFERVLTNASVFLSMSFFVSSALNYVLAKIIVKSLPGTTAFTEELGTMTWMSYPVIVVPSMIMMLGIFWHLITKIGKLTSLSKKEMFSIPLD